MQAEPAGVETQPGSSTTHKSPPNQPGGPPAPEAAEERWQLRFWSIWGGQALSLIGTALTQFVLVWWITLEYGSTSALAVAAMMSMLPQALLGPIGGVVADRFNRRLIMVTADVITAGCIAILAWLFQSGQVQLWHIYTLMAIRSSMQAFQGPAAMASTAMLVPESWLARVAGLNQSMQGVVTIAAAPLGALVLAVLPFGRALMVDVVTALLGLAPLFFFAIPQPARKVQTEDGRGVWGGFWADFWRDFVSGARVVLHNRGLLWLYILLLLVVVTLMPTFALTPLLVTEHFGGGVNQVAVMELLSGIGIIAGGLLIAAIPLFKRQVVTMMISWVICCAAIALTALMPSDLFWAAVVWWGISGFTFSTGNAPMMAILQTQVPNHLQGRVLALMSTLMGLGGPIGLAGAALFGEMLGPRGLFVAGGLAATVVCLLAFAIPSLMRIDETPIRAEWEPDPSLALAVAPPLAE